MTNFPLYFYPTTVCILDDCQRFLKNIILGLDPKFHYRQFHQPEEALTVLKDAEQFVLQEKTLLEAMEAVEELDEYPQQFALAVNIEPISLLQNITNRSQQISTLVVDFDMPSMNGLEVCQQLANSPIKKILITGKADHKLAVNAFNEGLIDHFILKDDEQFYNKLNTAIEKLHRQYFTDITCLLFSTLSKLNNFCLSSEQISNFITDYINKHTISQAYLLDSSGSLLFINDQQKKTILAIKNRQELDAIYDLAITQQAPEIVIESLKEQKNMLVLLNEEAHITAVDQWDKYLHPCQAISTSSDYFYSIL